MNRPYYQTPKPGILMRNLWKCAGADRYLLERSTYSDQIKYMCMGGIVLATGIMAALAGGYAFYTIFEPKGDAMQNYILETYGAGSGYQEVTHIPTVCISILFGLLWGLIIFNIDRFIVASSGKGDGTEAITWSEFKGAIPRIVMGLIIAITISKPLEIRMFKSEIDAELHIAQQEKNAEYKANTEKKYANLINAEQIKIDGWQKEIDDKEIAYTDAVDAFNLELAERPGGSTSGYGTDAKKKEATMNKREGEVKDIRARLQPQIDTCVAHIGNFEDSRNIELNQSEKVAAGLDGLLERIKLVDKVSVSEKGDFPWISVFITLLFMAIELTPIFFKLMLIQGPYDFMSDNVKELIKAENGIEVQYDYYKDKEGQERHLVIYHKPAVEIHEKIMWAESQKEITKKAIDVWKAEQLSKVEQNVNDFIKED